MIYPITNRCIPHITIHDANICTHKNISFILSEDRIEMGPEMWL